MSNILGLTFSPADIVRYLMVSLGLGTLPSGTGAWPISVGLETNAPDNVITIYDTEGDNQGRTFDDGETQEAFGLQVRVRATDYPTGNYQARYLAREFDAIVAYSKVSIQSVVGTGTDEFVVYAISRKGNVISLGKEPQTNRHLFTFNAVVTIQQTQ